jgi:hypothetical protein
MGSANLSVSRLTNRAHKFDYLFGARRQQAGQALAEGAASLVIFIPIALIMIIGLVNVFAMTVYSTKLNLIATEVVQFRRDNRYWLGMERTDITPEEATAKAQQLAYDLGAEAGIDLNAPVFTEVPAAGVDSVSLLRCTLTARGFKLPFPGAPGFPAIFAPSATITVPAVPVPPPCVVILDSHYTPGASDIDQLNFANKGSLANAGFVFPCYGGEWSPGAPAPGVTIPDQPNVPQPGQINTKALCGIMSVGYLRSPAGIAQTNAKYGTGQ